MANRNKAQGTRWEMELLRLVQDLFDADAYRLAEHGNNDRGDITFMVGETEIILEARDRETMQVHRAAAKASAKAGPDIGAVVWKRKLRKEGNQMRTQVGPPVVVMTLGDWIALIHAIGGQE